jgi:hypothetical protein
MYQGFQEPRNHCLARGVEPLGATALLASTDRAEDELEPAVAASSVTFFTASASSAAFFTATASSVAFFTAIASSVAFFAAAASSAVFFTTTASSAAFFAVAASSANFFAALHPQPLSLQRPLLPSLHRLQLMSQAAVQ